MRLLNSDVVSPDLSSSTALAEAIESHQDNPAVFHEQLLFNKSTY